VQLPSARAFRIAAIGVLVCAAYEVLHDAFLLHIPAWQSHVVTVLFIASAMFFLGHKLASCERRLREAIHEGETFANAILRKSPALLFILDAEGRFLRWNEHLENKLGYSPDDVAQLSVFDAIRQEDRERSKKLIEATFEGNAAETQISLLHSSGKEIPFYFTGSCIELFGKRCVLGIAVDISAQAQAENQLRVHATALEAAANGIAITGPSGTIEWVNPAFTAMTGFTLDEAIGNNPRLLKSGKQGREFYETLWKTISSGRVWRGEVTNRRKDGSLYTEEMTIAPVISNTGAITNYIAIKQDVTARKLTEEAIHRAEAQYRGIFDDAVIGIFRSTPDGTFLMMNPAMTRMLRRDSPGQAGDQYAMDNLFADSPQSWDLRMRIETAGTVRDLEYECRRRDGSRIWVSLSLRCIYNEDGTAAYYDGTAEDITPRKLAEEALHKSEQQLRLFVEHAPAALAMLDRNMCYIQASRRWLADYGLGDRDLRGVSHYEVFPETPERWKEAHRRALQGEILNQKSDRFERTNGVVHWVRWEVRPWYEKDGKIGGILIFTEDITEQTLLEQELRQAQKMDAVGRLAGGVAHDFNNLLGVITGYSELLKLRTDINATVLQKIDQIHVAGKRAASLTAQLLEFSRKRVARPRVLDLNEVVSRLSNMLQRLLGADIELIVRVAGRGGFVRMDESHVDQIIMNLAVNARDAMPSGGKLIIETDTAIIKDSCATAQRPLRPGTYVRLIVTDTGCGMDEETMSHLFEPFFTTKEPGKGTGLGLSIVYGVVRQADGYISVSSEPGQGTRFEIYLPLQDAEAEPALAPSPIESVNGSENLLVVEDDADLRSLLVEFLEGLGYYVLDAENGEAALRMAANRSRRLHVLITDVVMPRMNGRELANRLTSMFPDMGVLYTSGYSPDCSLHSRTLNQGEAFIQKPFALFDLGKKLREVVEARPLAETRAAAANANSQGRIVEI